MQNKQHSIKALSIYFCCYTLLSLSSCISNRFVKKTFSLKHYRIAKVTTYMSTGFSIPEIINDSTAQIERKKIYAYDGNQLVSIKTYTYESDGSSHEYSSDSIIYENAKNILVLREKTDRKGEKKNASFSMKTEDFFKSGHFIPYNNQIKRCDEGCRLVQHSKKHYELSYSEIGGNLWYFSYHYFLNDDGYIVKIGIESDTNASITVYEYESAYNPYQLYYTFDVINN